MAPTLSNARRAEHRNSTTDDDVARRAYELYETRGREPGHELDDWLQAERELSSADSDWRRPVRHDE
jgi:outer membrane protein TolC